MPDILPLEFLYAKELSDCKNQQRNSFFIPKKKK
jgi:hypothetical protein